MTFKLRSEHTIDGKDFSAELQIEHKSVDGNPAIASFFVEILRDDQIKPDT